MIPGITLSGAFRLRRGQHEFLLKLAEAFREREANHLGVFVPGYGKTITALASFLVARSLCIAQKLVVFVPRGNLRDQYADPKELGTIMRHLGAPPLSFCIADNERAFLKNLHTDVIITTYQYASGRGGNEALLQFCRRTLCMFVFDEVHHLSEEGTWAMNIKKFPFACSVALSGTPMRSDNKTLFGVPTETRQGADGKLTQFYTPLHEVALRDAHAEGSILKRVAVHVIDYNVKLKNTDTGEIVDISLSKMADENRNGNEVDAFLARKKLRFHEVYLDALLRPAFERFGEKRRAQHQISLSNPATHEKRQHQMLVIAMSNAHAAATLEFVQKQFPQYVSARIGQDVPDAERQKALQAYRNGAVDVMVQVDMIGEGTDIKPISIIVKADLVRALSKTLQQIFRGMRYYAGFSDEANVCDIYASNDSDVVQILEWIASEEEIGVTLKTKRLQEERKSREMNGTQQAWELLSVEHNETATHGLELFDGYMRPMPVVTNKSRKKMEPFFSVDNERQSLQYAFDVVAHERQLRQECSTLAAKLALSLASNVHTSGTQKQSAISQIHAAAIRRFAKTQDDMSIPELAKKRDWLLECLRLRKVI